jgi:hypothetical protein
MFQQKLISPQQAYTSLLHMCADWDQLMPEFKGVNTESQGL